MEAVPKRSPEHRPDRMTPPGYTGVMKMIIGVLDAAREEELTGSLTFTLPMKKGVIGTCKVSTERYFNVRAQGSGTEGQAGKGQKD